MSECSNCGENCSHEELNDIIQGESICPDCYTEGTNECYGCGERILDDDEYEMIYGESDNNAYFCSRHCFEFNTSYCEQCSDTYLVDDDYEGFCSETCYYDSEDGGEFSAEHWDSYNYHRGDLPHHGSNKTNHFNTKGFSVGVEVECIASRELPSQWKDVKSKYKQRLKNRVHFKDDCSINSNCGIEIVTCPSANNEYAKTMTAVNSYLKKYNYSADTSCGLHIHLGELQNKSKKILASAKNRHKILVLYNIFRDQLYSLVKPSRLRNSFCTTPNGKFEVELFTSDAMRNPEDYFDAYVRTRYNFINMLSYVRHRTIEIRLYHGTVDVKEINDWVKLNINMFNYAVNHSYEEFFNLKGTWREFKKLFLPTSKLKKHFQTQRNKMKTKVETPTFIKNENVLAKLKKEFKSKYRRATNKMKSTISSYGYSHSIKKLCKKDFNKKILSVIQ